MEKFWNPWKGSFTCTFVCCYEQLHRNVVTLKRCCCNIRKQQLISSKGLSSLKKAVEEIGGDVFVTEKEEGYSIASVQFVIVKSSRSLFRNFITRPMTPKTVTLDTYLRPVSRSHVWPFGQCRILFIFITRPIRTCFHIMHVASVAPN